MCTGGKYKYRKFKYGKIEYGITVVTFFANNYVMGLVAEGMGFTQQGPVETNRGQGPRQCSKALEEDDRHTIAPLYRDGTQDKGIVRDVFKETAGTGT